MLRVAQFVDLELQTGPGPSKWTIMCLHPGSHCQWIFEEIEDFCSMKFFFLSFLQFLVDSQGELVSFRYHHGEKLIFLEVVKRLWCRSHGGALSPYLEAVD